MTKTGKVLKKYTIAGVANQSDAKSHILFRFSAKSHTIHKGYNDRIDVTIPLNTHTFALLRGGQTFRAEGRI